MAKTSVRSGTRRKGERGMKKRLAPILTGAAAGLVNGFFGAGGGMIVLPLLEHTTDLSAQKRFATSVTIILPLSAVSVAVYLLRGGAFAAQAVPYLVGGAAGGVLAGVVLKKLPTKLLRIVFALFLVWGGVRLLLR